MTEPLSISLDQVLCLLRGAELQEFETKRA
jgi:hypothetical protein